MSQLSLGTVLVVIGLGVVSSGVLATTPALAESSTETGIAETGVAEMGVTEMGVAEMGITETSIAETRIEERYELAPETVEHSPTLQRWSEGTPDVLHDIRHDPSFRTRIQAGYAVFPSNDNTRGLRVGIEDWFIGSTGLTIGGDYQQNFRGDRESYGVDLHYYLLPLGSYVNVAPVVGYRSITTGRSNGNASAGLSVDGLNLGFQLKVIPSRGGGADFAYTQTWTAPNRDNTARTTELEFGYALTRHLRLSSEIEWQFTPGRTDSQLGVGLEWML